MSGDMELLLKLDQSFLLNCLSIADLDELRDGEVTVQTRKRSLKHTQYHIRLPYHYCT